MTPTSTPAVTEVVLAHAFVAPLVVARQARHQLLRVAIFDVDKKAAATAPRKTVAARPWWEICTSPLSRTT
jgi:hypothetical protein